MEILKISTRDGISLHLDAMTVDQPLGVVGIVHDELCPRRQGVGPGHQLTYL